jgi:hypothetical protein
MNRSPDAGRIGYDALLPAANWGPKAWRASQKKTSRRFYKTLNNND